MESRQCAPLIVRLPRLGHLLGSLIRARTLTGVLGSVDNIHIPSQSRGIRSIRLFVPPLRSLTARVLDPVLADMNNSLLPIEIYEHIIDSCREQDKYRLRQESYGTWCQTALVCSAWLPRSRLNLLCEVVLQDASAVDLLLRTLQEAPHFADIVVRLTVNAQNNRYVPFARMPLPLLLKKCVALELWFINWDMYPPRYADTGLYPWSGIVELGLDLEWCILRAGVRFIWSLRYLRTLCLRWRGDVESSHILTMWWPDPQTGKCQSLRSLKFDVRDILSHASVPRMH